MYTIQQAMYVTGVSRDMLRHYEKLGLLRPARNPRNGYREYSSSDLKTIVSVKMYNCLGVSLKECRVMLARREFARGVGQMEDRLALLRRQERSIRGQILETERLCVLLADYERGVPWHILPEDESWLIPHPDHAPENREAFAALLSEIPFYKYYYRIPLSELVREGDRPYPGELGAMIKTEPEEAALRAEKLTRTNILQYVLEVPADTSLSPCHMAPVFRWLDENGCRVCGDPIVYGLVIAKEARGERPSAVCLEAPVIRQGKEEETAWPER